MDANGATMFKGRGLIRIVMTLFLVFLFLWIPGLMVQPGNIVGWTPDTLGTNLLTVLGIEFFFVLMLVGYWAPIRYGRWAFRGVAGVLFVTYCVYLVRALIDSAAEPIHISRSSLGLLGHFIGIGFPLATFAWSGKQPGEESAENFDQIHEAETDN
jgi:hypothetical protein